MHWTNCVLSQQKNKAIYSAWKKKSHLSEKMSFLTFPACFYIPIIFSNMNSNWSNYKTWEQLKKAFVCQKLFWSFTVWINCSCGLEISVKSRTSASNFKSFSQSLEQFFLSVVRTKYPFCQTGILLPKRYLSGITILSDQKDIYPKNIIDGPHCMYSVLMNYSFSYNGLKKVHFSPFKKAW